MPEHVNVAMMTSGGLAPCLSSSVAYLIEFWANALKDGKIKGLTIRMYIDGYKGVLTGDSVVISPDVYDDCTSLHDLGGSPIGNSRVKVCIYVCSCSHSIRSKHRHHLLLRRKKIDYCSLPMSKTVLPADL